MKFSIRIANVLNNTEIFQFSGFNINLIFKHEAQAELDEKIL